MSFKQAKTQIRNKFYEMIEELEKDHFEVAEEWATGEQQIIELRKMKDAAIKARKKEIDDFLDKLQDD